MAEGIFLFNSAQYHLANVKMTAHRCTVKRRFFDFIGRVLVFHMVEDKLANIEVSLLSSNVRGALHGISFAANFGTGRL